VKIILFANTEWYLFNFRLSLAKALQAQGHEVLLISPPGEYGARLQALGVNNTQPWLLVTSARHMPRALAVFRQQAGTSRRTRWITAPTATRPGPSIRSCAARGAGSWYCTRWWAWRPMRWRAGLLCFEAVAGRALYPRRQRRQRCPCGRVGGRGVIASAARQSMALPARRWIATACGLAMTEGFWVSRGRLPFRHCEPFDWLRTGCSAAIQRVREGALAKRQCRVKKMRNIQNI
jgi:hypothetical protein